MATPPPIPTPQAAPQPGDGETHHYVSERKKRGRAKPRMQPPLTPMIDVTFQLLIFFLLTASFRKAEGQIPGSLPTLDGNQSQSTPMDIDPIRVKLIATGMQNEDVVIEVGAQKYQLRYSDSKDRRNQVAERIHAYVAQRKKDLGPAADKVPVIIAPEGPVRWRYIVEAYNQVVRVRFKNIGFAPLN